MLLDIDIRQFRSCHNVKLNNIAELLVLIGRNGAGKTNILKAVEWACKFACVGLENLSAHSRRNKPLEDGDVGITFSIDDVTYRYEVSKKTTNLTKEGFIPEGKITVEEKIYLLNDEDSKLIVQRSGEHLQLHHPRDGQDFTLEISRTIPCIIAINAFISEDNYFRRLATSLLDFFSSVEYYPLHNFDESFDEVFVMGSKYIKWTGEKNLDSNTISSILYKIIDLHLERKEILSELIELIGENGLGLIDDIEVSEYNLGDANQPGTDKSNAFFYVSFSQPSRSGRTVFSINDLSFGTKRVLFLLVAMLYDKASVALLEQPEDGVHIGLVDKLVPLFRAYSEHSQFVIASHSATILNRSAPEEIYFISKKDGMTTARPLTENELCIADTYLREDGSLSDFVSMVGDD
jgi:predicted ATPase